ncbi:trypsin [Leptinotarsa decemlineata]|uniref:trypsin n=1 Tax=Leptinotarsa decemlineata TaxID=7539 RepID=UPI000C2555CF|nr:trypsin-like [Leptinotarsa decemlineata]
MQLLCVFVCFLVSLVAGRGVRNGFPKFPQPSCGSRIVQWNPNREARVIGGEEPPVGAAPWQIDLRQDGKHICGGALIGARLVLSAAHCYNDDLTAVAGAHGPPGSSPHEQLLKIEKFVPHPDFRKLGHYSHDLAVLLVSSPGFKMNSLVAPACFSQESPPSGTWCEVSGWGADDPNDLDSYSSVLKIAAVPIISLDKCRQDSIYGGRHQQILDSMMCAGHLKGGIDACFGDSGGPLVCDRGGRMELAGITSWGDGCAKKNKPGVYTRVSSFLPWINDCAQDMGVDF